MSTEETKIAIVDRRVEVVRGNDQIKRAVRCVSDLRALPFVVILGEPGIGKSTVLKAEAAELGATVIKVREIVNGVGAAAGETLFLDALDEYRSEGDKADKIYGLANAIANSGAKNWRVACRSEDWRDDADIAPIRHTADGGEIVVVSLLPLDHQEARLILESIGEPDPDAFLARAEEMGANGFIESPLSLYLLHRAVAGGGDWPETRYELFDAATQSLAYEHNSDYKYKARSAPDKILGAAGEAFLMLLVSGARAVWRSNGAPPTLGADVRAFVTAHDLPITRDLLLDSLDTALFRGDGEAFEPMHRTIAEFLAAKSLADATRGAGQRAALPLSRALALITSSDGAAPTESRGFFAWFAASLSRVGDEAGTLRMIEADASTVLAYGDAAAFGTALRRAIFKNLDRNDPYFRASEVGATFIGGLAGEDLASDFQAVLNSPTDGTHRTLTVLDALTSGRPVPSLRPTLKAIVLDPTKPDWIRWRAADAWLNSQEDVGVATRELFDALSAEPISVSREAVRIHLAAKLPNSMLRLEDVRDVLADFEASPDTNLIGGLYLLQRRLVKFPVPELFDEATRNWRPDRAHGKHHRSSEVERCLDNAMAACIRSTKDLSAERLWDWIRNVRDYDWEALDKESQSAVAAWIDQETGREVELFDAMLGTLDPNDRNWRVAGNYRAVTGKAAGPAIVRHLVQRAQTSTSRSLARHLLQIAIDVAHQIEGDNRAYWELLDYLQKRPNSVTLLRLLTISPVNKGRWRQLKRKIKAQRQELKRKARIIATWTPLRSEIEECKRPAALAWAAAQYYGHDDTANLECTGLDRLHAKLNDELVHTVLRGWRHSVETGLGNIDAAKLGRIEGERRRYHLEFAAIAGLDRLLAERPDIDSNSIPLVVAIAVLKSGFVVRDDNRRNELEAWSVRRLSVVPDLGSAELLSYWNAALDAGDTELRSIWKFAEQEVLDEAVKLAIGQLLSERPNMPKETLRSALKASAKAFSAEELLIKVKSALGRYDLCMEARAIWVGFGFAIDPREFAGLVSAYVLEDEFSFEVGPETLTERDAIVIRLIGRTFPPDHGRARYANWGRRKSDQVGSHLKSLEKNIHPSAGAALLELSGDPTLSAWHPSIRHVAAQRSRVIRDETFVHPKPAQISAVLDGGEPVNAADLKAITLEELDRLKGELRSGDTTSWKRYWNLDEYGRPVGPLIENQCRDNLLDRLRDRLKPYKIAATLPEARRAEETRADALLLSGAGRNLPIEVKRHFHPDIWTAAGTQLLGYASDPGADGYGIYLVFWFGNDVEPTPSRPEEGVGPNSADELGEMLRDTLSLELREMIDIVVFDVSNPEAAVSKKPRQKRAKAKRG